MTQTLLMWLWPMRMVISWKPTRWSWMDPNHQTTNPLVLNKGFRLSSKIFLLGGKQRWGEDTSDLILMRNRGQHLGYQKEKIIFSILKIKRRKKYVFSKSYKSRGERDMKIHFSSSRGKTKSNFSSRISRDRDSGQGLFQTFDQHDV